MSEPNQPSTNSSAQPQQSTAETVQVQLTSDTTSISDLFAKAPLEWNQAERLRAVELYRKQRKDLIANEGKPAKAAKIPAEDLKGISGGDLLSKLGMG